MRNTELRIGNIVEYLVHDELANPKSEWVENVVDLDDLRAIETSENYRPAKLTKDWLLKFGFETDKIIFWNGFISVGNFKDGFYYLPNSSVSLRRGVEIQHVHQLQNLYFSLTGEELTYVQP